MQNFMIWAKQIFILSILVQLIRHLVSGSKYDRYLNYVGGLMMVTLTLWPVGKHFFTENLISDDLWRNLSSDAFYQKIQADTKKQQPDNDCAAVQQVSACMQRDIQTFAKEEQLLTEDVQVEIDMDKQSETYGNIRQIQIWMTEGTDTVKQYTETESDIKIEPIKVEKPSKEKGEECVDDKTQNLRQKIAQFYRVDEKNIHIYE